MCLMPEQCQDLAWGSQQRPVGYCCASCCFDCSHDLRAVPSHRYGINMLETINDRFACMHKGKLLKNLCCCLFSFAFTFRENVNLWCDFSCGTASDLCSGCMQNWHDICLWVILIQEVWKTGMVFVVEVPVVLIQGVWNTGIMLLVCIPVILVMDYGV